MTAPDPQPRTPDAGAADEAVCTCRSALIRDAECPVHGHWPDAGASVGIEALIEASSLGTPAAKAARESVPPGVGRAIALAARYLGERDEARADLAAARSALARVEALCAQADGRRTLPGYVLTVDLRAALAPSAAEPGSPT